jgi:hypothetical protein
LTTPLTKDIFRKPYLKRLNDPLVVEEWGKHAVLPSGLRHLLV